MNKSFKDSLKRLSADFLAESLFYLHAWHYSFPKQHPDGKPFKFSEWFEQKPKTLEASKEGAIWFYKEHAEKIASKLSIFPDPIKNMAFVELHGELTMGRVFEIDTLRKQDYRVLGAISQRYFSLSILYEHYQETLSFIAEYAPDENPYFVLEHIRETLSKSGNRAIGYWYSNSQEVRGFVEREKRMQEHRRAGAKQRAEQYKDEYDQWQALANGIWGNNPVLSKNRVAGIIAEKTESKQETIRKHIKKP